LDSFTQNGWRSNNRLCFLFFLLYVFSLPWLIISFNAENDVNNLLCAIKGRKQFFQ
jgi:hypothetical protein